MGFMDKITALFNKKSATTVTPPRVTSSMPMGDTAPMSSSMPAAPTESAPMPMSDAAPTTAMPSPMPGMTDTPPAPAAPAPMPPTDPTPTPSPMPGTPGNPGTVPPVQSETSGAVTTDQTVDATSSTDNAL